MVLLLEEYLTRSLVAKRLLYKKINCVNNIMMATASKVIKLLVAGRKSYFCRHDRKAGKAQWIQTY